MSEPNTTLADLTILGRDTTNPSHYFSPPMYFVKPTKVHKISHTITDDLELRDYYNIDDTLHLNRKMGNHIANEQPDRLEINLRVGHFSMYTTSDPDCLCDTQATIRKLAAPFAKSIKLDSQKSLLTNWITLKFQRTMCDDFPENQSAAIYQTIEKAHSNPTLLLFFTAIYLVAGIPMILRQLVTGATKLVPWVSGYRNSYGTTQVSDVLPLLPTFLYCLWSAFSKVLNILNYVGDRYATRQRLHEIRVGLEKNILNLNILESWTSKGANLKSAAHKRFWEETTKHIMVVKKGLSMAGSAPNPDDSILSKILGDGALRSVCYSLKKSEELHRSVMFIIGAADYFRHLEYVATHPHMHPAEIIDSSAPDVTTNNDAGCENGETVSSMDPAPRPILTNQVHPPFLRQPQENNPAVSNTVNMKDNLVLTGPNASGKTTVLKSVLLNLIYTQQYGYGFYDECKMPYLYDTFHSYLNIPVGDNNSRDSLFESEARQCLSILDDVRESNKHTMNAHHFCIFDELFSGTNPTDAVATSAAFLGYLTTNHPEVDFVMTTHYTDMCKYLRPSSGDIIAEEVLHSPLSSVASPSSKQVNYVMMATKISSVDVIVPAYKLIPGVSTVFGAVSVLRGMNYPNGICDTAKRYIGMQTKK